MDVEAVVLTGGASRRMGEDKAQIHVDGEPSAERICRLLSEAGFPVTILGPGGVPDPTPGAGPLAALGQFEPTKEWVFVASCDLPRFDARVVPLLRRLAEASDAAVPSVEGRAQPLCAIYRASALAHTKVLTELGVTRVMAWLDTLDPAYVSGELLSAHGLDVLCVKGANTPEEWRALVGGDAG